MIFKGVTLYELNNQSFAAINLNLENHNFIRNSSFFLKVVRSSFDGNETYGAAAIKLII